MSYRVTKLVRRTRLPRTMRRRPAAKLLLLALADRADDDGRNSWPSVATMAEEAEVSTRTASKVLEALVAVRFIAEQLPPTQRRPRTYCLNLDALKLDTLDVNPRSELNDPSAQNPRSELNEETADARSANSSVSSANLNAQLGKFEHLARQHVADDPVLIQSGSCPSELSTPAPPGFPHLTNAPSADGNYAVVFAVASELLKAEPDIDDGEWIDRVKRECARLRIAYNGDVVHRACAAARHVQRTRQQAAEQKTPATVPTDHQLPQPTANEESTTMNPTLRLQHTKANLGFAAPPPRAPEAETEDDGPDIGAEADRLLRERTFENRAQLFAAVVEVLAIPADWDAELASNAAWARHVRQQRAAADETTPNAPEAHARSRRDKRHPKREPA